MKIYYVDFIRNPMRYVKIDPNTNCWIWQGALGHGYGILGDGEGGNMPAHVWFYTQKYGPVPKGKVLDHVICDNPPCCNPDHVKPEDKIKNWIRSRVEQKFCKKGHELTLDNIYVPRSKPNWRQCRKCREIRHKLQRLKDPYSR